MVLDIQKRGYMLGRNLYNIHHDEPPKIPFYVTRDQPNQLTEHTMHAHFWNRCSIRGTCLDVTQEYLPRSHSAYEPRP